MTYEQRPSSTPASPDEDYIPEICECNCDVEDCTDWCDRLKSWMKEQEEQSMKEADGMFTRFHLRVDPDGRGMLLANATAAARL